MDALCIIQDSDEDKLAMMYIMDRVYESSLITLIATPASESLGCEPDGLLSYRTRDTKFLQDIVRIQGLDLCVPYSSVIMATIGSPWSSRSWTFQEEWLSRRRLYFTASQLYFQCTGSVCCEDAVGEGQSSMAYVYLNSSLWNNSRLQGKLGEGQVAASHRVSRTPFRDGRESSVFYNHLVEQYSDRSMTHQTDALLAIEGVLAVLRSTMGTQFMYGLPIIYLNEALLWLAHDPPVRRTVTMKTTTDLMFPTWSWAGWQNHVNYRTVFVGRIRPEIDWYLITEDRSTIHFVPKGCGYIYFDASKHQQVRPKKRPYEFMEQSRIPADEIKQDGLASCSLACWTTIASFHLKGDTVDSDMHSSSNWTDHENFIISDPQSRPVGSIWLHNAWSSTLESQSQFEFMLLSRSNEVEEVVQLAEGDLSLEPWCFLNVMLVKRKYDTVERLGIGVIHEDAWVTANPVCMFLHLR